MKKILFIYIALIISISVYSQENSVYGNQNSINSIYGSFGFNPEEFYILLNFNFEKEIYSSDFVKINGRTGVGFWLEWTEKGIEFPLTGQALFFKKKSHLEIGGGAVYIYDFAGGMTGLSHLLNIAYRFQKPEGGFLFRIGAEKTSGLLTRF